MPPALPEEHQGHREIAGRGHRGEDQAEADVAQGSRVDKPVHGRGGDGRGGYQDQYALHSRREVLRLLVAVGVLVRGSSGNPKDDQSQKCGNEVDDRLDACAGPRPVDRAAGHDLLERLEEDLHTALPYLTVFTHLEPIEDPLSFADEPLDRPRNRPDTEAVDAGDHRRS